MAEEIQYGGDALFRRPHKVQVYHYDAFSTIPGKGNPAGVVLHADGLTPEQMQSVARQVGFNETVFVLRSDTADLRLRYFTPGHEMNLCGHATVAAFFALKTRGLLGESADFTLETKAGLLPIRITTDRGQIQITMRQAPPEFAAFHGSRVDLAASMGITAGDLHPELPILYGSTGTWTLLVPIRSLEAFGRMAPENGRFPSVLRERPRASVHPFGIETLDPSAHMHARHFSSPFSGTVEDPVTGTASGVMGAYYCAYIDKAESLHLVVEQGFEVGRDGRVFVHVNRSHDGTVAVSISGTAVYVSEFAVAP